jgi:hypothetical protein
VTQVPLRLLLLGMLAQGLPRRRRLLLLLLLPWWLLRLWVGP